MISSCAGGDDETEAREKVENVGVERVQTHTENGGYGRSVVRVCGYELVKRGKGRWVYDMEVVRRMWLEVCGEFGWTVKEYFWEILCFIGHCR